MTRFGVIVLGLMATLAASTVASAETVTGEVIDTFCYASMGAKGSGHKQCGVDCAKKGIPVGLLEEKTGKVFVLLPSKDKTPLPNDVIDKMGSTATVTGKVHATGGSSFLTVESVK